MKSTFVTLLVGLAVLASACGGAAGDPGTTAPGDTGGAPSPGLIANSTWNAVRVIVGGVEVPIVPGSTPTIQFSGNDLSGDAGCNSFFGSVTIGAGTIDISELGMTEMACEPRELMTQEAQFARLLAAADTWTLEQGTLTIGASDGSGAIEFVAPVDRPAAPLVGTTWRLDTLVEGEAASSVEGAPTLVIDGDTVSGSTGCNTFTGFVRFDEGSIRVTDLTWTEIGCGDQLQRQEQFVLETLLGATSYELDGDRLTINAPGNSLVYVAS